MSLIDRETIVEEIDAAMQGGYLYLTEQPDGNAYVKVEFASKERAGVLFDLLHEAWERGLKARGVDVSSL